jgi:hypothetical protein
MRQILWGFCRNLFPIDPLHYLLSRSDFVFKFAEIFVIEKRLPDLESLGRTYAKPDYAKTPENPPHCHVLLRFKIFSRLQTCH